LDTVESLDPQPATDTVAAQITLPNRIAHLTLRTVPKSVGGIGQAARRVDRPAGTRITLR
jgi:hypothetical protein